MIRSRLTQAKLDVQDTTNGLSLACYVQPLVALCVGVFRPNALLRLLQHTFHDARIQLRWIGYTMRVLLI